MVGRVAERPSRQAGHRPQALVRQSQPVEPGHSARGLDHHRRLRPGSSAVAVGVAALAIAATTAKGQGFLTFAKDSRIEVRKVVWPTRQEAIQTTFIVLVATLLMSLLLWGLDSVLFEGPLETSITISADDKRL